jgi:hypothetical protein
MPQVFTELDDELYAKLVWKEHRSDIRDWLLERGLTEDEAEEKIRQTQTQLRSEARRAAKKEILRGAITLFVSGVSLLIWSRWSDVDLSKIRWFQWTEHFVFYAILTTTLGFFDFLVGIFRLIFGTEGVAPSEYGQDY